MSPNPSKPARSPKARRNRNVVVICLAVFFGMIGVTAFGLLFTPVFYVICRFISDRLPKPARSPPPQEAPGKEAPAE